MGNDREWIKTRGSRWHKVAKDGEVWNKWARNPDWKASVARRSWNDPTNPYYLPRMEHRVLSMCGTIDRAATDTDLKFTDNPVKLNKKGKRRAASVCAFCMVHLEYPDERPS